MSRAATADTAALHGPVGPPESTPFPSACITTPHYLATLAGLEVLRTGGNAVDAAVAANLALGVVAPYRCGYGGDLVAMLWTGEEVRAYLGIGAAGARADLDAVAAAAGGAMPVDGPLTVTVPGAVQGWFDLLAAHGTRSFAELAGGALALASEGFRVTAHGAGIVGDAVARFADRGPFLSVYGEVAAGGVLRQPGLARTIATLADEGPGALYEGEIGHDLVTGLEARGGSLDASDLAGHRGRWVEPLRGTFAGREVLQLPPPSQGATALLALGIAGHLDLAGNPHGTSARHHLLIEAVKRALADRDLLAAEPAVAADHVARILDPAWIAARAAEVDPARATPAGTTRPAGGGTACILVADGRGGVVNLVQSNLAGFGSGETIAPWGLNLHNRGSAFSLDPASPRAIGPGRRPLHTLVPSLVLEGGWPVLAIAASGGDGQVQTQLSVLASTLVDGLDPARAMADPRWLVDPATGDVAVEDRLDPAVTAGLEARGHRLSAGPYGAIRFGCGHTVRPGPDGPDGSVDPRCEGLVAGL